jgi:hypothetical protein
VPYVVFLRQKNQVHEKIAEFQTFVEPVLVAITGLLTFALFISGAFLSRGNPLPEAILRIHQVAPLLALAFLAMTTFMLITNKS